VISFKPTDELMTYASYSKGYKAAASTSIAVRSERRSLGGQTLSGRMLRFEPEKVDAFEIGAKFNGRGFDLNVAAFYQLFDDFQLNAFTGTSFVVVNIAGCSELSAAAALTAIMSTRRAHAPASRRRGSSARAWRSSFHPPRALFFGQSRFTLADTKYRTI
jgi:outer membrane receptor for Fe3+-dicitrate